MHKTCLITALLLGAAAPLAISAAPAPAGTQAPTAAGIDETAMDRSVRPGDEFYQFSAGAWQQRAQIPADRSSIGAHTIAADETDRQQMALIRKVLASSPAAGSDEARIRDYWQAYLDTAAIERAGLTPLKADLARYAAITDNAQLTRVLGDQTEADVDLFNNNNDMSTENLFGLFITKALKSDAVVPYIFQGGLGLPDREYYVSTQPRMVTIRDQYRTYIASLLRLSGVSDPEGRAGRILDLETRIAAATPAKADTADFTKGGTLWSRADFARNAPGMDWDAYFTAARMPAQQTFDVYSPSAITGLAALVGSQSLEAWKDWLAFHRINAQTDVLPAKLDALHFAFFDTTLSGTPQQKVREKRALAAVNDDLGMPFGRLYVAAYFPAQAKAQVSDMATRIKHAFDRRIDALDWMAPATRTEAQAKLAGMVVSVGYPDTWPDSSLIVIKPGAAYANRMAAIRGKTLQELAKLGKPQDRGEWWMTPQMVNAVNLPVQNALNFPAAILQKPFFDPAADLASNYGAIGAVIGHEISHSFDTSGAAVDGTGTLRNWWTAQDLAHFEAQSQALVAQYDAYAPFPDLHLNGKLELGENGADVAGLAAAYDAYREALGGKELPVIDGYTGDQRFFIAYAQGWATKTRDGALRRQVIGNAHAPGPYRALTVRNVDAWYKAFDVKPGDKLYLDPAKRVHLW
ncbi:M13 family metallopeptidase [Novosphingobium sp. Leaf2]|uniref:M13 family metallopeptidase n=1 Tax=Novosphingobium sp. Leaf2 TaxID=1735670 RepID=UPI0006FB2BBB|nr:M13 family metallopeptidase [Novosphingobium sp. Leaf2]KQM17342.1 metalloendopeptidase [Novosphingobium sp. Leaf2]